jgi:hypothetical protein
MEKKLLAIIAIVIVASLSVAGCTTTSNTTNNTNQTTSAAAHNAFLEKYFATYKNILSSDTSMSLQAWEVTWINSTSARIQWAALNTTTNVTEAWVETIMLFPTIQGATNYVNATDLTNYSLANTVYSAGAYQNVTGHAPQIDRDYVWNEGNPSNISEYRFHEINQLDNTVWLSTKTVLGVLE